jgi:mono/diheme cytochrome c family protein
MNSRMLCALLPHRGTLRPWVLLLGLGLWFLSLYGTVPAGLETAAVAGNLGTASSRTGRVLFQKRCADCHEADGTGSTTRTVLPQMPDFTNHRWQQQRSDTQLVVTILEGKGAQMPAFGGKINKEQARELITYIRAFAPMRVKAAARRVPTKAKDAEDPEDDFDKRFRKLQEEFDQLSKQLRELSRQPERKRPPNK